MINREPTSVWISPEDTEPKKIVGKYKTYEEAKVVVDDFLGKYSERLRGPNFLGEIINGYNQAPTLETTKKGNQRWGILIRIPKPLEEMSEQERKSLFGKSFKRMPIIYQAANFEIYPAETV